MEDEEAPLGGLDLGKELRGAEHIQYRPQVE
jgi:hypothetical protein